MKCVNTANNRLYYKLVDICDNEKQAQDLYSRLVNPNFIKEYNVKTDSEGIPLFKEVYNKAKLNRHIKEESIIKSLEKDLSPKTLDNNNDNINILSGEVTAFNNNNEVSDFVAVIEKNNGQISSKIVRKNNQSDILARKIKTNSDLHDFLVNKLAEVGVSVGVVSDLERRRGIAGVTEFERAKDATNGTVELIRIAKGEKGAEALPEEFSHFALEAVGEDNPLVSRLYNSINVELAEAILGDQYERYYEEYNGDIDAIRKEVAGKLLAEYIKAEYTGNKSNLLEYVFEAIKDKFSQLDEIDFRKALIELDATLTETSKTILFTELLKDVGLTNITSGNRMYNLKEEESEIEGEKTFDTDYIDGQEVKSEDEQEFEEVAPEGIPVQDEIEGEPVDGLSGEPVNNEGEPVSDEVEAGDYDEESFEVEDLFAGEEITDEELQNQSFDVLEERNKATKNNRINIENLKKEFNKDCKELKDALKEKGENDAISKLFINIESSLSKLNNLNKKKGFVFSEFDNTENLKKYVYKKKNMVGNLLYFVYNSINNLHKAWELYENPKNVNRKCDNLIIFNNTIQSIDYILNTTDIQNVMDVLAMEFSSENNQKIQDVVKKYVQQLQFYLKQATQFVQNEELLLTKTILSERFGDTFEIPMTLADSQTLTLDDELSNGKQKDVSFLTRFFSSLANSPSLILKMVDQIVKKSNNNRRNKVFELKRKIVALGKKYVEKSGSNDFSFLYNVDKEGKRTGYYNDEVDYAEYDKVYREVVLEHKDDWCPNGKFDKQAYKSYMDQFNDIAEKRNNFHNNAWDRMNAAQKEFAKEFLELKKQLDDHMFYEMETIYDTDDFPELDGVPVSHADDIYDDRAKSGDWIAKKKEERRIFMRNRRGAKTIKIEKSLINKLKSSKGIKGVKDELQRAFKELFVKTSSDVELSENSKAYLTDFKGKRVYDIPRLFTAKQEGESEDNMSMDAVSTLVAYSDAAENRFEKMQIVSLIELITDIVNKRKLAETKGDNIIFKKLKTHFGDFKLPIVTNGDESNISKMLKDYVESQIYGMWNVELGTIGDTNISKDKIGNLLLSQTAVTGMALNVLGGISNIETGKAMMRMESICGQFFNVKDVAKADLEYTKNIGACIAEAGSLIKENKMAVFIEQFNILQDYEQDVLHTEFDTNNFVRCCSEQGLFILNNLGEHFLQTRTALSVAIATKLKNKDGKEISLWEAMELRYIDPKHPEYGKKIFLKEGVKNLDGSDIDMQDYFDKFVHRSAAINQRMHGIYNYEDRCAAQRYMAGRFFYQFRKYIPSSIQRRFGQAQYNFDLNTPTEGYYRTFAKFWKKVYTETKAKRGGLATVWKSMNKWERQNCIRSIVEMSQTLLVFASVFIVEAAMGDEKKQSPWALKMLEYQTRRLYSELAAFTPSTGMLNEALKIIDSPTAGCRIMDKNIQFLEAVNPWNWFSESAEIQQGKWKGHSKGYKAAMQILPIYNSWLNVYDPYEATKFYKK